MSCRRNSSDQLMKRLVHEGIHLCKPPRGPDYLKPGNLVVADKTHNARKGSWEHILGFTPTVEIGDDDDVSIINFRQSDALLADTIAEVLAEITPDADIEALRVDVKAAYKESNAANAKISILAPFFQELTNLDSLLAELREADSALRVPYEDRRLFVVTRTWACTGLKMVFSGNESSSAETNVIMKMISAKIGAKLNVEQRSEYIFQSPTPKIFGVSLVELVISAKGYIDEFPRDGQVVRGGRGPSNLSFIDPASDAPVYFGFDEEQT